MPRNARALHSLIVPRYWYYGYSTCIAILPLINVSLGECIKAIQITVSGSDRICASLVRLSSM
jgi:hypothetical protein